MTTARKLAPVKYGDIDPDTVLKMAGVRHFDIDKRSGIITLRSELNFQRVERKLSSLGFVPMPMKNWGVQVNKCWTAGKWIWRVVKQQ